jgi:deferrochelatase/peroxidase EfeB
MSEDVEAPVEFYGRTQAGITTSPQRYLTIAAYDLATDDQGELEQLLVAWSAVAAALMSDQHHASRAPANQPPADPGEALGLPASRLTLTFGLGASLFERDGVDRLGLRKRMPGALRPLPTFAGEALDPTMSGGDLCIQACAEDPQVAFHAIHVLSREASGLAVPRWAHQGFRSSNTPVAGHRNLFGFREGAANIDVGDANAVATHVWAHEQGPARWMTAGSYLVFRRIRMLFDVWDSTSLDGQERVIGRHKESGAPLGANRESDQLPLRRTRSSGELFIPSDAHVRLAHASSNGGARILRRSYGYDAGIEPHTGQADAGLLFISYQRDPHRQFARIQRRLADSDALNKHTVHVASACFACPPGARRGRHLADGLFRP